MMTVPFSLRVKFGSHEIEISGTREEVMKTIEELPHLIASVSKAFDTVNIKVNASKPVAFTTYPTISSSANCSEAVLRLLKTDWGKQQPRTLPELVKAMKASALHYPSTTLSGVLVWLVKKDKVKRWKTDKGYVYALAEKET
jgi:exopolysaccharide biosynthesis predicted pyruvyltransferase EpsI